MPFLDRADAGRRLAGLLAGRPGIEWGAGTVVLGLPRGGIPVAYQIARALDAPLDVILVRKIGLPAQPELAMGAIGEDGVRVVNDEVIEAEHVSGREFAGVEEQERAELGRRADRYRAGHPRVPLTGKTAIVVDDGIATGSTARAACQVARAHGAARVVLAVPVAPPSSIEALASVADEIVCVEAPEPFLAIGQWYQDFAQTADEEVVGLLDRAAGQGAGGGSAGRDRPGRDGPAAGTAGRPGRGARGSGVRARQREQPHQPAQHVRGRRPARGRAGQPALRPAHAGGGSGPGQRVRHRPAGQPAVRGHRLAARAARPAARPGGVLRGQHRGGRGAAGRRRP